MKFFLFFLLAGYAVRCDDNNYYVIEMLEDPPPKPFKIYWNVPTMQCQSKKIPFNNLFDKFGIIQNTDDKFQGDKVSILYDPGLFPALLKNETSGRYKFRNGGVPQEGDLDKHLVEFEKDLDLFVPDTGFNGIGIIDFESWRPVYRQNFGALQPYKDVSLEIERRRHWWWQTKWLQAEAKQRFEDAARTFMQSTLSVARRLRPNAVWGFYGFPYCFNMASNNMNEACASNVPQENDNMSWLWQESSALYPSVYSSVDLSTSQLTALIRGRVREATRFGSLVLPYFWYRYRDADFLSETDLDAALSTLYKSNASGFIIWGSSSDVNTVDKCNKLLNYIDNVMGPAIAKYTQSRSLNTDDGNSTVENNKETTVNDDVNENYSNIAATDSPTDPKKINHDPEYHWVPPENYTQTIKDHVAEEISKKLNNHNETNNSVFSNNVLIDLILNSAINSNFSESRGNNTSNVKSTVKTESTTEVTIAFEAGTTFATHTVTNEDEKLILDLITSTKSVTSFEDTTDDDPYSYTSQANDKTTEYTTSTTADVSTITIDENKRDKSEKKSSIQDNLEEFFDVTETTLITETTELNLERNTVFNYVTPQYKYDSRYATEETVLNRQTTEKSNEINDIKPTTNIMEAESHPNQFRPLDTDKSNDFNEKPSTKAPVIKNEANEVTETLNNSNFSTKSPIIETSKISEDMSKSPKIEKTSQAIEDTSLVSTSSSPDQVVVYV